MDISWRRNLARSYNKMHRRLMHDSLGVVKTKLSMDVLFVQHIETEWRIYASIKWATTALGNDLLPARRQAIICPTGGPF